MMQQGNYNKRNVILVIIAIVILGMMAPMVLMQTSNSYEEIRPIAEKFMQSIVNQKFDEIAQLNSSSIKLNEYFSGEGKINTYKESGFGTNSKTDVWIHYYVTGLPSETRNISLNFRKESTAWKVFDIRTEYHINRGDKQMVLEFIELISVSELDKILKFTRDILFEDIEETAIFLNDYNSSEWIIVKAINKPYLGKYPKKNANKTIFILANKDDNVVLKFYCKNLKNEHWIYKIEINKN